MNGKSACSWTLSKLNKLKGLFIPSQTHPFKSVTQILM